MRYTIELEIPALQSCLHAVLACVTRLCRTSVGSEDPAFQQAVLAACSNAIRQSYGGDNASACLELCFYVSDNELAVDLVDYGRPCALSEQGNAPLGLIFSAADADEVRYERVGDHNLLHLMRRGPRRLGAA
ncbi:MAG: hypothetical protein H7Y32_04075 [Chloroflexales bacterium]|nr:hypothetical protein [Chloroflexales bacterium]